MRIAPLLRRSQASACATRARHCAQCVLCWPAFPLAFALRSTGFAADRSGLFFTATMASPEFLVSVHHRLRLFVFLMRTAGVSRGRPDTNIPAPIRLRVMWPSTPAFGVAAGLTQTLASRLLARRYLGRTCNSGSRQLTGAFLHPLASLSAFLERHFPDRCVDHGPCLLHVELTCLVSLQAVPASCLHLFGRLCHTCAARASAQLAADRC